MREVENDHEWKQLASDAAGGSLGASGMEGTEGSVSGSPIAGDEGSGVTEDHRRVLDVDGPKAIASEPRDSAGSLPEVRYSGPASSTPSVSTNPFRRRASLYDQIDQRFPIEKGECRAGSAIEAVSRHVRAAAISMTCASEDCREISIAVTKLEEALMWFTAAMRRAPS